MLSSRKAHELVVHAELLVLVRVVDDSVLEALEEEALAILDGRHVPRVVDVALDLQILALQELALLALCDGTKRWRWRCLGLGLCGLAVDELVRQARLKRGLSRAPAARQRSDDREHANGGIYCVCRGGPCGPGSIAPNAARSFTELFSSLTRGKRLRAPVQLRWAALWLCTEEVDVWGRDMHRLGLWGREAR